MTNHSLPRQAALQDTPHTLLDADMTGQREQITTLDLAGCNVTYINVLLLEHEKADGHRFEHWPEPVRVAMEREVAAFVARNAGATVKAVTTGVSENPGRMCVLAIHWRPRS